jgi:hypothetical protein
MAVIKDASATGRHIAGIAFFTRTIRLLWGLTHSPASNPTRIFADISADSRAQSTPSGKPSAASRNARPSARNSSTAPRHAPQ